MTAPGTFEPYISDVYAWAYRLLGHHQDSLDVVQDVFVKWNQQCTRECPHQPRGWLRRATLNRVIDLRRRAQLDHERIMQIGQRVEEVQGELDPDLASMRGDLANALDQLTEIQRSVVVAKVYDNLTFAEIAAEHDLAVSTVKTHYVRALGALHGRLRGRWGSTESEP